MQRPLRELGRLLGSSSGSASAASNNDNNDNDTTDSTEVVATEAQRRSSSCEDSTSAAPVATAAGLPLLQVWPSDSPRADNDETSAFVYPEAAQQITQQQQQQQQQQDDSGIDSIQRLAVATVTKLKASPTPTGVVSTTTCVVVNCSSPATTPGQSRRPSLLHPDHARIHGLHHHHHHHHHHGAGHHHHHHHHHQPHHHQHHHHDNKSGRTSPDRGSILDGEADRPPSPSSSTTSSLKSMPSSAVTSTHSNERRRSSRYSMFDALDLEYALLRAAARGSVGPYSLSESLHKLTFTQSLAFPALARGLATKQTVAAKNAKRSLQQQHGETGMNAFAKVVTALVLVLVSVLVFGVVYKFVRT